MIIYDPKKLISQFAPKKKIEKLLSDSVSLKKTALSFVNDIEFIDRKTVSKVALKAIKEYKKRIKAEPDQRDVILNDPKLLVQRVQNAVIFEVHNEIKSQYKGESYVWLPSDAEEPDPEHQLKYGKTYQIGDGEMPGDRYGCRCGMQILVDDSTLSIT